MRPFYDAVLPKGSSVILNATASMPSHNFKEILSQHEFVGGMSRKGDCWDNAVAESFHTLKVEWVHCKSFRTRDEAKRMIFEYVEMYYNRKRAHSALGFLSPAEYEKRAGGLNE